jgi:hypothetical protein
VLVCCALLGGGAALATVALPDSQAEAATLLALDLPALVQQSDYVVVANAQTESSRFRAKLIVTDVELRVVQALKGATQPGATLVATRLGGTVDNLGLSVPGEASFPMGKSAIVFLRKSAKSNELSVVGMSQGVLPISGEGGAAQVLPSGAGATLMQRGSDGKLVEARWPPPSRSPHRNTPRPIAGSRPACPWRARAAPPKAGRCTGRVSA